MFRGRAGRGRGRGSRRRGSRRLVTSARLNRELRGHKIVPALEPPVALPRPWNTLRLVMFGTGTKLVTDSTITTAIKTQVGIATLTSGELMCFKLRECRAWCQITQATPLKSPFTLEFRSIFGESFHSIQSDYGGDVNYARVGYVWPASDQNAVLAANPSDDQLIWVRPVDTSAYWVLHVDLLWSIQAPAPNAVEVLDGAMAVLSVVDS